MAAKKKSRAGKKKVTITIDAETLQKLGEAVEALSEFAAAFNTAVDDPELRRTLLKRSKKRR